MRLTSGAHGQMTVVILFDTVISEYGRALGLHLIVLRDSSASRSLRYLAEFITSVS